MASTRPSPWFSLRTTFATSSLLLVAACGADIGSDALGPRGGGRGADPCTAEHHCARDETGVAWCAPGTTWVSPDDPNDFRCGPVGGDPGGGSRSGGGDGVGAGGGGDAGGGGVVEPDIPPGTGVHNGDMIIESLDEYEAFRHSGIGTVTGTLELDAIQGLDHLRLGNVHTVGEDLIIKGAYLTASLPHLEAVDDVEVTSLTLVEVTLPQLERATEIDVLDVLALERLDLRSFVEGPDFFCLVRVRNAVPLAELRLDSLNACSLELTGSGLTSLELPALEAGTFIVADNPSLAHISLPALLDPMAFQVDGNAALTTISAPQMNDALVEIRNNPLLVALDFPAFDYGFTVIEHNTNLSTCLAVALFEQAGSHHSSASILGNGPGCEDVIASCRYTCFSVSLDGTCGCGPYTDEVPDCADRLQICGDSLNGGGSGSGGSGSGGSGSGGSGSGSGSDEAPPGWTCHDNYYDEDTDACDCGCGLPDPDCGGDGSASICDYDNCASGSAADPFDNSQCTTDSGGSGSGGSGSGGSGSGGSGGWVPPDAWVCPDSYYDDGNTCDCGCGMTDPDCYDDTSASCERDNCGSDDVNPMYNHYCL